MSVIAQINAFLQSWDPPTKGPRADNLGNDIRQMLCVAKKYNTNLAAIRLSPQVQMKLPAWYHPVADPLPLTTGAARCLLRRHHVKTVEDLVKLANCTQTRQPPTLHQ